VVRFVFAQTGVKYEDFRVAADTNGDQWREMKPSTPFGVLPVLEIDGKQLGGNKVIARYLAEQFGLAGENTFENAQIANIADAVQALNDEMIKVWFEKDEARKAEMQKKLEEEIIPEKLQIFEKRASKNDSGWLTRADFFLYISLEWAQKMTNDKALSSFPGLTKLRDSEEALPNIAKWIKERPVTEY